MKINYEQAVALAETLLLNQTHFEFKSTHHGWMSEKDAWTIDFQFPVRCKMEFTGQEMALCEGERDYVNLFSRKAKAMMIEIARLFEFEAKRLREMYGNESESK